MSTSRHDFALAAPPPPPAAPPLRRDSLVLSAARGYQALRQRWICMGPRCLERDGFRSWCKLPARIQLQEGWCCSPECFQEAFEQLAASHLPATALPRLQRNHRIPLGLLLLSRGQIDQAQLRRAIDAQHQSGEGRIGDWLVRHGAVTDNDVAAAVGLQWARPLFPLEQSQGWRACRGWIPLAVLEALRMLPLHFAAPQRRFYVGFTQAVDSNALAALAAVFECKTEACIVSGSALQAAFDQIRVLPASDQVQDIAFDRMDDAAEIAGVVRQYAQHVEARQIRLAAIGPFLWVRVRGDRIVHLTFRGRN